MHRRLISFKEHLIGHGHIWSTWASFRDSSMLQNIQIALTNNDIDLACLLWARHHIGTSNFELKLTDDDLVTNVQDILLEIPLRIHVPYLLKFLKLILKHKFVSNELHAIQKWIWKFAENIEMILHKPKDALLLLRAALLPEPININTPNLSQSLSPTAIIRILTENGHDSTSVNKDFYEMVHSRTKALEDILELAVSSEFFITLSDYEKSTPSIIGKFVKLTKLAMSLIDRIQAPELIPNTIEKHVVPFITKHQLPLDQILQSYYWEGRVLVVLNMITSIDTKGEVLLECMRRSPIPWSENLDIQIMEVRTLDFLKKQLSNVVGPFQGEITEQHKLMKLRKMIQGYGINSFNVSDLQLAKRLIPYILKRVDSLTAVEDAFQVKAALLRNGKELEGISDSYSALAKSAILQEFLCWVDMQLEMHDEGATPDSIEPYILAGKIALNIMGVGNNRTYYLLSNWTSENVYHRIQMIYKNTESILRPSQLVDATFVRSFMDRWIERQLPEAVYGLDKAFRIGNLLQLSRDYILGRVATYWTKSNNLQHVSIICQEIVQNYTDESMDETLMDLLNTLISSFSTVRLHNVAQTVENLLAIVSIFLCYTTKHLEYALKVYKVCDILHHVVLQSDLGYYTNTTQAIEYSAIRKIFSGQYCESGLVISSDKLINNIGIFLVQPDLDKVGIQKGKGKQQSVPVKEKFQDIIDTCIQTRNYQIAFRLLQLFYENEVLESIPISLDKQAMSTSLVYELLEGLFHSVTIDYDYCLACMISLPKSKASGLLQSGITSAGRDYNRIQRIARVGAIAGTLWSQRSFQVTCLDLIKNSHWQNELQTLEIPFEDNIFRNSTNGNTSALKVLVPCLLYQTRHDLELVLDYGECYLLEPDFIYLEYIKQLLSIKLDFPPREQIFKKVKHAINQVANKQKLGTFLLIDCFEKASPYDYELLRFINEMVLELDPNATSVKKHLMMIDILLQYTRTSKPSEVEMSLSFDLDVGIARLEQSITSVWSQYYEYRFKRLPFHLLLKNPVEILNMELDESMINRLLPLARVLNYPTEKVYESLIHKSIEVLVCVFPVNRQKIQLNSKSSVVLSFSSFKPWINKLNDYELAIRTTVFVAGNYPRGEDRILAYKLALEFAERWRNSLQQQENSASLEKARTGWKNVKSLLSIAETEHMLQTHNLQQLDKYVTKPYQLVSQLLTPNPTQPSIEGFK
ncbi:hypothetical protein HDV02_000734 [Globomyces sp. JEL0801]|nr:hypothetical protein HDV02_000734 [Globomyces sp. JEL0801]